MAIMLPKQQKAVDKGASITAKKINAQIDVIVNNGPKYNDGKYQADYSQSHAKVRKRKGYQTGYTDLQMDRKSVMQRSTIKYGEGVYQLTFMPMVIRDGLTADQLFYFHNWGEGNNPRRQLFPDTKGGKAGGQTVAIGSSGIEPSNQLNPSDRIPKEFVEEAKREIKKILMRWADKVEPLLRRCKAVCRPL